MARTKFGGVGLTLRLLALGWALAARPFPLIGSAGAPEAEDAEPKWWVYVCTAPRCTSPAQWKYAVHREDTWCSSCNSPALYNRLSSRGTFVSVQEHTENIWICTALRCMDPPARTDTAPRARPGHPFKQYAEKPLGA